MDGFASEMDERGFGALRSAVWSAQCDELLRDLAGAASEGGKRGGARLHLAMLPSIHRAATQSALRDAACRVLGPSAFPVRVLYFDKTAEANWRVAWHQDVTIAVRERVQAPGFGPWSVKAGSQHVQPPVSILERMVAVRLHLDDCGGSNGPLRVIPGSHKSGRLSASDIAAIRARDSEHSCVARRGDVIVLRPLLLHASSPATEPGHRRVLHIEFACEPLPGGLEWFEQCA
jgi:phytanoyl-CoA dioxygenase PhyH